MPLGRSDRRGALARIAFALPIGLAGCNMLPFAARTAPKDPEVWTRVDGEAPVRTDAGRPRLEVDPTAARSAPRGSTAPPDASPLPPAIERPGDHAPVVDDAVTRAGATAPSPSGDGLNLPEGVRPFEGFGVPKAAEAIPVHSIDAIAESKPDPGATAMPPPPLEKAPAAVEDPPFSKPLDLPPTFAVSSAPAPANPEPVVAPTTAPAPAPTSTPAPAPALKPEEGWKAGIERLREVIREGARDPAPGKADWAAREHLLDALNLSDGDVEANRNVIRCLSSVLDPSAGPAARSSKVREAIGVLEAETPFEVVALELCRKVNGFGDIETLDPATRRAGQAVVLYSELSGLTYEKADAGFRSRVVADVDLIPQGTETPAWSRSLGTLEDRCRRRRHDYYANYRFNLAETLLPGTYRLRLRVRDLANDRGSTAETSVVITR